MLDKIPNPLSGSDDSENEDPPGVADPDATPASGPVNAEQLQTPLSPDAVAQARETITDGLLEEQDRPLVELLNDIQQYIDNQEYVDRAGNAFIEQLVDEINDRNSLRRLLLVGDQEVFVLIGAEGWAEVTDELGFSDREAFAVRDAHHTYAEMNGLEEYVTQVNVMAIRMYDERLAEFLEQIDPEHAALTEEELEDHLAALQRGMDVA